MFKSNWIFVITLLIFNVLACKNEPTTNTDAQAPAAAASAPQPASNINFVSKEKISLKDTTEIVFPKEGDQSSTVFYFATPGQSAEGSTSVSEEGQAQGNRLAGVLANAGLSMIYIEGNAAMQTALGAAKANASEFNMFKADNATETLKLLEHNFKGKKVMVCAAAPIIANMMAQLTGQPAPAVPTTPNNNLYVVVAKGLGSGELKTVTY